MGLGNRSFPDFPRQRGNDLRALTFDVLHYLIVKKAVPPRVYKVRLFHSAPNFMSYMVALDILIFVLNLPAPLDNLQWMVEEGYPFH